MSSVREFEIPELAQFVSGVTVERLRCWFARRQWRFQR
jgi:hypothetical protein